MSVSFIINSSGKPKELYDMSDSEINNLSTLLSGPINNLNKSRVSVIKNRENPIKLSDLSVDSLAVLKASVNSYKNGRIKEVHMYYSVSETELISALIKCNMNVSMTDRELHTTRDKVREAIKRFRLRWGIDLTTYAGLSKAYTFSLGS